MKKEIKIYEVAPRDGLQNEKAVISAEDKIEFINLLGETGLTAIEATSFVRPGVIPALSDSEDVFAGIKKSKAVSYPVLVPNQKGYENAMQAGAREIAVFTAASNTFTRKNINSTIEESLQRFGSFLPAALNNGIRVRGYISTVIECPYEGMIKPSAVHEVCQKLFDLGVYEISLGETIGTAVPDEVAGLLDQLLKEFPAEKLAGHFHDTHGTALANVFRALEYGIRTFDSSAGGLGGCPYASGASGNLATEDLLYALERSGFTTGVNAAKVAEASAFIEAKIGRSLTSKAYQAWKSKKAAAEDVQPGLQMDSL